MSRGYERHHDKHHDHHHGLSGYGKDLVRRCAAHCEMCDAHGVKLNVFEVPSASKEAAMEHCIMICGTCMDQIEHPKRMDHNHWRCLNHSMWSTVPAVKVMAVMMLQRLAESERWAVELLEQVYLEPEVAEWLKQRIV
ncbi:MAG: phnA protein [Pontibacterium sp.]